MNECTKIFESIFLRTYFLSINSILFSSFFRDIERFSSDSGQSITKKNDYKEEKQYHQNNGFSKIKILIRRKILWNYVCFSEKKHNEGGIENDHSSHKKSKNSLHRDTVMNKNTGESIVNFSLVCKKFLENVVFS